MGSTPRRAGLLLLAVMAACPTGARASGDAAGGDLGPLAHPGDYSLAPVDPVGSGDPGAAVPHRDPPSGVVHGAVSSTVGSGGTKTGAIALDTGLLGPGTHAFVQIGAGEAGPSRHAPKLSGSDLAAGVSAALSDRAAITVEIDAEHDRWSAR